MTGARPRRSPGKWMCFAPGREGACQVSSRGRGGTAPWRGMVPLVLQTLAGYSAIGVEQMAILMGNDAGLPLGGPGFDNRKPDQLTKDLTEVTRSLMGSPSFRGWSWASNWWIFEQRGANAARTP